MQEKLSKQDFSIHKYILFWPHQKGSDYSVNCTNQRTLKSFRNGLHNLHSSDDRDTANFGGIHVSSFHDIKMSSVSIFRISLTLAMKIP